jgi:hypothetical protein
LKILLYILNATLRLEYWPTNFKLAKIIMMLKPTKPPKDVASYRPISLLPIITKILEKLILHILTMKYTLKIGYRNFSLDLEKLIQPSNTAIG